MKRALPKPSRLTSVLLGVVLSASAHADPAGPDRPTIIPLTLYLGQIPSLAVRAAGREVRFLLDTAGGITAVTPQFASDIGCRPWGQITGFRMRGERLELRRCDDVRMNLAGAGLTVPTAGVWDLAKILPPDAPPLAGSLALDAFAGHAVTLDLASSQLVVETPASLRERTVHAIEVPVRFDRAVQGLALTPLVAVETSQGRLWMELDCGSDGAFIVGRHAAAILHLDPAAQGPQKLVMALAGGVRVEGNARVEDLILDGNIGVPVLRRWIVTLDLAHHRLWIAPRNPARRDE